MMIGSFALLFFTVYPDVSQENSNLTNTALSLFIASMVLAVLCWWIDPGYIQKDPQLDFLELLE